jgi:hypothetical protein
MHLPHPWTALRGMTDTYLHWRSDLPPSLNGATRDNRIWLRSDLTQVERRCVLAHELEHCRRGHDGCQPPAVERAVQHGAACYLLPSAHLVGEALVWAALRFDEAADVLWVTERMLRSRLDPRHLDPADRAVIAARVAAAHLVA